MPPAPPALGEGTDPTPGTGQAPRAHTALPRYSVSSSQSRVSQSHPQSLSGPKRVLGMSTASTGHWTRPPHPQRCSGPCAGQEAAAAPGHLAAPAGRALLLPTPGPSGQARWRAGPQGPGASSAPASPFSSPRRCLGAPPHPCPMASQPTHWPNHAPGGFGGTSNCTAATTVPVAATRGHVSTQGGCCILTGTTCSSNGARASGAEEMATCTGSQPGLSPGGNKIPPVLLLQAGGVVTQAMLRPGLTAFPQICVQERKVSVGLERKASLQGRTGSAARAPPLFASHCEVCAGGTSWPRHTPQLGSAP